MCKAFLGPITKLAVDQTVFLRVRTDQIALFGNSLILRFQLLLHLSRIRHERAVRLGGLQNGFCLIVSGVRLFFFTLTEQSVSEPEPFSAERLHKSRLFESRDLLISHKINSCTAVNLRILAGNDKGHDVLVFAFHGGVGNTRKYRIVFITRKPPPTAHQHVGKRVLLLLTFGKLLHFTKNVLIYLIKSAFIVSDLP